MKLYYSPGVCSLAPHIVLREADLDFTLEKVDADTKRTETGQDYRKINPHGYVPALEIEPGVVLTEGPAIMQYLADRRPSAKLAPAAGTFERYRLQSWLNFITSEIHKGYSPLFKPNTPAETKAAYKELLATRFDHIERHLATHDYLMDSGFSIADAYLFVTTGWSGFVGIDLAKWPALVAFRKRIEARPSVQAALKAEGLVK
ncbi:glutathione transferase GstA [Noviherbaspirillum cavernae]|uniref:Glutathione transferase GstA n=1 Tax=Noviherbaspirillum cavernae TaxID=2320862 RepID=A0A418WWV5_9BURK|nr:glutathione transferase GstA [Noviherbaspirillum cavernae]RJG04720.1 glutathione transferase GstA [Noviherbaspirillum cavernae]